MLNPPGFWLKMASKGKGKAVVDQWSSGKRKREDGDESGGLNRKNPGVLKFFDVSAEIDGDNGTDDSEFEDGIAYLFCSIG